MDHVSKYTFGGGATVSIYFSLLNTFRSPHCSQRRRNPFLIRKTVVDVILAEEANLRKLPNPWKIQFGARMSPTHCMPIPNHLQGKLTYGLLHSLFILPLSQCPVLSFTQLPDDQCLPFHWVNPSESTAGSCTMSIFTETSYSSLTVTMECTTFLASIALSLFF